MEYGGKFRQWHYLMIFTTWEQWLTRTCEKENCQGVETRFFPGNKNNPKRTKLDVINIEWGSCIGHTETSSPLQSLKQLCIVGWNPRLSNDQCQSMSMTFCFWEVLQSTSKKLNGKAEIRTAEAHFYEGGCTAGGLTLWKYVCFLIASLSLSLEAPSGVTNHKVHDLNLIINITLLSCHTTPVWRILNPKPLPKAKTRFINYTGQQYK